MIKNCNLIFLTEEIVFFDSESEKLQFFKLLQGVKCDFTPTASKTRIQIFENEVCRA